ncbi:MAG: hypothetical protein ACLQM8_12590 [Limisphaerales bacterium]
MSDHKPNWVDYSILFSNEAQNRQLDQVQSALQALARLEVEKSRHEMNDQEASEAEDHFRDFVWSAESELKGYLDQRSATACGSYALANLIQSWFSIANITSASFRQFKDKDRLGRIRKHLQQTAEAAESKLSPEDKRKADRFLAYQSEAKEFGFLVALQQEYLRQQERIKGRDGAVRRLEDLRQRHSKLAAPPTAPTAPTTPATPAKSVGCLFLLAAVGCFLGSLTIDAVSKLAGVCAWLCLCAALVVVGAALLKKRKISEREIEKLQKEKETFEKKREAFQKEKEKIESGIEQARQQVELADSAIELFDPQRTRDEEKTLALTVERQRLLKKYGCDGIDDEQVVEAEKSERESFVRQFAQDNHLPAHEAIAALKWEPDDDADRGISRSNNERLDDAVQALICLNFNKAEALDLVRKAQAALGRQATVEDLVRACLKK